MIKKKIRLIKRFHEISLTLSKLGFYNAYEYFKLLFGLEVEAGAKPRKIREALEKLGPSFIKLGQVLYCFSLNRTSSYWFFTNR